jgi:hypothetical protein
MDIDTGPSTRDDVRELAIKSDDPILYRCIQMHEHGYLSWEQAMQLAAISLSEQCSYYKNELFKLKAEGC